MSSRRERWRLASSVPCPYCRMPAAEPCVVVYDGVPSNLVTRSGDPHQVRVRAGWEAEQRRSSTSQGDAE